MPLVFSCFVVMLSMLYVFTYRRDPVKRMWSLPAAAGASIMFAIAAAFGLAMFCGWPFTVLSQSLPFIIVAIGVDDVLLVETMEEVKREHPQMELERQVERTMRHAGVSITVTSVTNMVAFALGVFSSIPALQGFGIYASLCILFDYVFQFTFFLPCMVLVQRRMRARDAGRCNCLSACLPAPTTSAAPAEAATSTTTTTTRRWWSSAPRPVWVLWPTPVKIIVLLAALAGAATSLAFIGHLSEGLATKDLVTKGSFYETYQEALAGTYGQYLGPPSQLYFRELDHADPAVQLSMLQARDYLLTSSQYASASFSARPHWLGALLEFAEQHNASLLQPCAQLLPAGMCGAAWAPRRMLPAAAFHPLLARMLAADARGVAAALSLHDGAIVASYFVYVHVFVPLSEYGAVFTEAATIQNHINEFILPHHAPALALHEQQAVLCSTFLLFAQSNTVLWDEAVQNLSLAATGVLVLTMVLLVHPSMLIPVALVLFVVDAYLFGLMLVLKIPFNSVSVIILVMAVGLSVDYSVHVMHAFLTVPGESRSARAYEALRSTGRPVMMGAATTLVGVTLLAAGRSFIFLTFFKLLFGTAIFASVAGLVLVPIVLSLAGPAAIFAEQPPPKEAAAEVELAVEEGQVGSEDR